VFSLELIVVKRVKPLPRWIIPVIAFITGFLIATLLVFVLTRGAANPVFVFNCLGRAIASPQLALKNFGLLTIIGIGLVISFRAALFNIGGEGQFYFAIVAATWVALFSILGRVPVANKVVMLMLGMVAAGLWALIAALIRTYSNIDEVPVTLLMNYIMYYIVDYLVFWHWREQQYKYARTPTIPVEAWFSYIPGTNMTLELLILTVLAIIFAWFLLNYTRLGLAIRVAGSNPLVLRTMGISVHQVLVAALTISGVVVGLAGVSYLAGEAHLISIPAGEKTPGLGYSGILVAWLSLLEVFYVPVAAYIVSLLLVAGIQMQITGIGSHAITDIFIGSILLTYSVLIAFSEYKVKVVVKRRVKKT